MESLQQLMTSASLIAQAVDVKEDQVQIHYTDVPYISNNPINRDQVRAWTAELPELTSEPSTSEAKQGEAEAATEEADAWLPWPDEAPQVDRFMQGDANRFEVVFSKPCLDQLFRLKPAARHVVSPQNHFRRSLLFHFLHIRTRASICRYWRGFGCCPPEPAGLRMGAAL
jgi:hypothetical protein